ncbi:hypothetical protein [uncultured Bacteroides sp.]|uniref:hypothetical protein n=1 Tax=uncultured Bacteroides sp. TaxID=162156 RepID=UPI0025B70041|nr:hypothetical protein [uncultured Bacteroides sp.]
MIDRYTSSFDANEYIARMRARQDAEIAIKSIVPEGAMDGNPWEDAPSPRYGL